MKTPKISVIIPSLNTKKLLIQCIKYLRQSTKIDLEILVLDLGDDKTYEWCKNNKVRVWRGKMPYYFSQSCNFLADKALGDYLLFLNPDTIPQEGFLEEMLVRFNSPTTAIVGCKLLYPKMGEYQGAIQHAGVDWKYTYPTKTSLPIHIGYLESSAGWEQSYEVKAVTGACMLVDRAKFAKLKFDERFKNGYEDVDLCIRAKNKGYEIWYVGKAEVIHYVSGTGGTDGKHRTSGEFQNYNTKQLLKKWAKRTPPKNPIRPFKIIKRNKSGNYVNRLLIGTATTGEVRMEWVMARYGQVIPTNWSQVQMNQFLNPYAPIGYQVADAQNLIVKAAISSDFEWLLLIEHDNVLPEDAFLRFNRYIKEGDVPVVSGLYYTKTYPAEPIVYRGRGTSAYNKFSLGDKVWCDGVPTGVLLIHMSILRAMWQDAPEYMAGDTKTRRIFDTPRKLWFDPQTHEYNTITGTSDLDWCTRVMEGKYFEKAGWGSYQKKKYPFLVDTNIFCRHILPNGVMFP